MKKLFNIAISIIPILIVLSFFMPGLNIPVIKYVPILVSEVFQLVESDEKKKNRLERERLKLENEQRIKLLGLEIKKLGSDGYLKYLLNDKSSISTETVKVLDSFYYNSANKNIIDYHRMLLGRFYIRGEYKIGENLIKGFISFEEVFGKSTKPDPNLGSKLFKKAAESNLQNIQIDLMMEYNSGEYFKQDKLLAYMYGRLALAHPDTSKAQKILRALLRQVKDGMTESEIAQGEKLASLCKGKNYKNCGY